MLAYIHIYVKLYTLHVWENDVWKLLYSCYVVTCLKVHYTFSIIYYSTTYRKDKSRINAQISKDNTCPLC